MADRLLIIDDGSSPAEGSVTQFLPHQNGTFWDHAKWETFQPEELNPRSASLVIAVATAGMSKVLDFFRWVRTHPHAPPSLAILPANPEGQLLRAASEAVDDFMLSPIHKEELCFRIKRILGGGDGDTSSVYRRLSEEMGLAQIVGNDPAFARAIEKIPPIAASDLPVLLTGETGTGKELCARAIHYLSRRRDSPFVPVECGAFPEHLVENELFGHVRGAFTDAHTDQKGLVALAERGTLFLDEVDTLSVAIQAKLLRFLQERSFRALGSERFCRADVRVIAATNRDIEACVSDKQVRSDLYYRLNVLRLHLPPLRERPSDIAPLARHFLNSFCEAAGYSRRFFSNAALTLLSQHEWPGNVRELLNVVQRAVIFSPGPQILPSHITLRHSQEEEPESPLHFRQARAAAIADFERLYVRQLLLKHAGNVTRAAREAGKDRRAFGRLVKKYNLNQRSL